MENKNCDCSQCVNWEECEIGLIVHYPINKRMSEFNIKKGDKVAQCTLKEHKGYLMGYESDVIRDGGFGSTGA
jgi:dUTPase